MKTIYPRKTWVSCFLHTYWNMVMLIDTLNGIHFMLTIIKGIIPRQDFSVHKVFMKGNAFRGQCHLSLVSFFCWISYWLRNCLSYISRVPSSFCWRFRIDFEIVYHIFQGYQVPFVGDFVLTSKLFIIYFKGTKGTLWIPHSCFGKGLEGMF